MQQHTAGTVQTAHHLHAGLTDDEARRLEGAARRFYMRVLVLQNETGCSVQQAVQACQDADRGSQCA
jgi:hypothetical protein